MAFKNVILDTDTYNEVDDQFALAYLLRNEDRFKIEAITIAPFFKEGCCKDIQDGQHKSYQEVLKIMDLMQYGGTNKVYKGANCYTPKAYRESNQAADKIIEICLKNEKTYILAIGAITNIAVAIQKEPSIVKKIEVIWLGSNSFLYQNNKREFNFRQDIQAVRDVFASSIKLTVIPARNVSEILKTTIYELKHYLAGKKLGDYFLGIFKEYQHGRLLKTGERKTIWDISAVAYLINPNWFETIEIPRPTFNEEGEYILGGNGKKTTFVKSMDPNRIFEDLFKKIE